MSRMKRHLWSALFYLGFLPLVPPPTFAQDQNSGYVTREEYDELKAELKSLKQELTAMKKEKRAEEAETTVSDGKAAVDLHRDVMTPASEPEKEPTVGTTNFVLSGWGMGMFENRNGGVSTFSASLNPVILWEIGPKLLFESRLELELSGSGTGLELEYANLSYLFSDYITLGIGEFLTPSNVFVERFEALWINKLPDRPLAVYDGILPERSIGVQVRGGFPIGPTSANYAFYVSNGPNLNAFDASRAGTLEFNNFTDANDNKAVGGRVGFLPVPGFEVGYGFEVARPGTQGSSFSDLTSVLQTVDLNVTRNSDLLKGRVDLHAQYAWSHVDTAVYDPDGSLGFGPLTVDGKRDGGYAQVAYRPTRIGVDFLKDTELVLRWDHLSRAPSGVGAPEEQRWTLGLNYWLNSSTVIKAAYEWDRPSDEPNKDALLLQVATGF